MERINFDGFHKSKTNINGVDRTGYRISGKGRLELIIK